MYEQLDMFAFLEPHSERNIFNPIEEFAKRGSGFSDGEKRIVAFFSEHESITDRAEFLKKEYGMGGFGMPCDKPFIIHDGWSDAKGCKCQYFNESMENIEVSISYSQLAKAIDTLIKENRYVKEVI